MVVSRFVLMSQLDFTVAVNKASGIVSRIQS